MAEHVRQFSDRTGRGILLRSVSRVVVAVAAVSLYVGLAALSGHLSPTTRGPLLDGLGPAQPYKWVNPPTSLAPTNQPPSVGTFVAKFVGGTLHGRVFVTADGQATVIVPNGAFTPHGDDDAVVLTLTPVDPGTLGALPDGKVAFGNAYRLSAAYRPSGAAAPTLAAPLDLVLLYPVTPNLHSATHSIYASTDGRQWGAVKGTDTASVQQVEGKTQQLGYAVAAGTPAPSPPPTSAGSGGGGSTPIIVIAVALSVLLVGIGFLLRSRGGSARS
jgi:hypothetical protein